MAKPPFTYLQGVRNTKNIVAAQRTKVAVAVAAAELHANAVRALLKKAAIDRKRLADIKALAEAVKKGEVGDQKRATLLKGVKELIDLAKHQAELAKASSELATSARGLTLQAHHASGPTPNLGALVAPVLLFILMLDKFLAAKPRQPPK